MKLNKQKNQPRRKNEEPDATYPRQPNQPRKNIFPFK